MITNDRRVTTQIIYVMRVATLLECAGQHTGLEIGDVVMNVTIGRQRVPPHMEPKEPSVVFGQQDFVEAVAMAL